MVAVVQEGTVWPLSHIGNQVITIHQFPLLFKASVMEETEERAALVPQDAYWFIPVFRNPQLHSEPFKTKTENIFLTNTEGG